VCVKAMRSMAYGAGGPPWHGPCFDRPPIGEPMLMIILIVFLLMAMAGGGWGHSRYGYVSWSPLGLIALVLVVLWLTGSLHA
jgi:hypothetical protein